MVCSYPLDVQALRFPWWYRPRLATACVLLGPLGIRYKVIFKWLLFVLGLEVPRPGQAVNKTSCF